MLKLFWLLRARMMRPRMMLSADKRLFYITDFRNRPTCWMSVGRIEGAVPEERKKDLLKGWLQVQTNDGRLYYRELLTFTFWTVKTCGALQKANLDSDEFKDYLAYHVREFGWKGY